MLGLMRTTDLIRRTFSRVLEGQGITLQQYNVLRILRGAGDSGLPTLEIGSRMIEESPGITRLIDRLEAKVWVRRERCPHDRRQVLCWITPSGLALLESLEEPMADADDRALSMLSTEDKSQLIRLLDAIRAGSR